MFCKMGKDVQIIITIISILFSSKVEAVIWLVNVCMSTISTTKKAKLMCSLLKQRAHTETQ